MPDKLRPTTLFECPHCNVGYKVVRAEVPDPTSSEIACLECGGPLAGSEGPFVLKYFLVDAPKEVRQRRSAQADDDVAVKKRSHAGLVSALEYIVAGLRAAIPPIRIPSSTPGKPPGEPGVTSQGLVRNSYNAV